VQGDFGTSWRTGKPVVALILERLPVTLELTLFATAFALALGGAAGIVSAIRRDQAVDNVTRVGTLLGLSVPVFWQGTMLILFFSLYLRWMPPVVWVDFWTDPRRNLTIMMLPALCLGTASAANIARTTRACMLDVLNSEYIRTAAAKGLASRVVVLKHALRNALIPVITVVACRSASSSAAPWSSRRSSRSRRRPPVPGPSTSATIRSPSPPSCSSRCCSCHQPGGDLLYSYSIRGSATAAESHGGHHAQRFSSSRASPAGGGGGAEAPRQGEVLAHGASGVCHSCLHAADGAGKACRCPSCWATRAPAWWRRWGPASPSWPSATT
jgi:ABC-type amino acid transport system permease subunit